MRKVKFALAAFAIIASVGGAFATKKKNLCGYSNDGRYLGINGYDYVCDWSSFQTCTYTEEGLACEDGRYIVIE